jgi:hypothetical protein
MTKNRPITVFIAAPFVVSGALQFLPFWVSAPTTLLLGLLWIGAAIAIGKGDSHDRT